MNDFVNFLNRYKGAIIGCIIAILLLVFELDKLIIGIVIISIGIFSGNYVQRNKQSVKENLKKLIDKM